MDKNNRIADLHREIDIRDRHIEELEQQLLIKSNIIIKQGLNIAELNKKVELNVFEIEELKLQLATNKLLKDDLLRKISRLQEKQIIWHRPDEKPPTINRIYACRFKGINGYPILYKHIEYNNNGWNFSLNKSLIFAAWAEVPTYEYEDEAK